MMEVFYVASPSYPVRAGCQCSVACHRGSSGPHLVVSGYAEQKAEPDMLTLNVAVTALEKQGIKAKQQVDTKVAAFFGQLESLGIKRSDVGGWQSGDLPEYQYPQNKQPEMVGYRAQRQLAVKLYQLDKLSQLMDTALKAGLESVTQIEYGLKSPQVIKEQARLGAVADATSKAESLAKAFGMKLGKVYSVEYRNSSPCRSIPCHEGCGSPCRRHDGKQLSTAADQHH